MQGIYGLEGFFLLLAGIEDIKKKQIHTWYILAMGVIAVIGCLMREQRNWYGVMGGLLVGLCMLGISLLSEEQIGKGDGMVVSALGILCGVKNTLGMVCFASFFMVFPAVLVIIRKKGSRKTRLPFLPALFLGYLMVCSLGDLG